MKHLHVVAVAMLFWLAAESPSSGQTTDEVVIQASTARSRITMSCTVLEYNGQYLLAKTSTGSGQQRYDASEIVSVKTRQTESQKKGLSLLEDGRPDLAESAFTIALDEEPRQWARREILALLVRAALQQREFGRAGTRFRILYESDPYTRHIQLIPLIWNSEPVAGESRAAAIGWLRESEPMAQLLGASLLMFDQEHYLKARATIRELNRAPEERVRRLAWWQQWRLKISASNVSEFDVADWESRVTQSEPNMRSGSYFIVGQGLLLRQEFDLAAAAFLQIPLVYPTDHPVTSDALFEAGQALTRIGLRVEAARLLQEVVRDYPRTEAAGRGQRLLTELLTPKK